jgi:hypothetical protein
VQRPLHQLKVNEDVNALAWLPNSACALIVATEDNLILCDTRKDWQNRIVTNKHVTGIKFDPFDLESNRFATLAQDYIKIFDIRNLKKPLVQIKNQDNS